MQKVFTTAALALPPHTPPPLLNLSAVLGLSINPGNDFSSGGGGGSSSPASDVAAATGQIGENAERRGLVAPSELPSGAVPAPSGAVPIPAPDAGGAVPTPEENGAVIALETGKDVVGGGTLNMAEGMRGLEANKFGLIALGRLI